MQTITLGRARYTVADTRTTFLTDILKITGKHKPVKAKIKDCPGRAYPKTPGMSTADYVKWFYAANKLSPIGFYDVDSLSAQVSEPQGMDSMEVEP